MCGGSSGAGTMARDYDYLFKLLIIGDSGKETPRMRDGKQASGLSQRYLHVLERLQLRFLNEMQELSSLTACK